MGRIRILSDNVANKIAAGEVVERPASVVKELLENSLDAGATHLRIDVESGGRRLMRVADDGCGLMRDDAMLAFERHATSKLSEVNDLLHIATLGFRGEALPSIASVSRLTLETRADGETTGTRVEVAGGKMLRCEDFAAARGTTITVRDLFFNVPARKKFLRSDPTELAHIGALVTHYSLAHPDKTFHLRHGAGDLLHVTPVAAARERVFQVFGSDVLDELIDLEAAEREIRLPPPHPAAEDPDDDELTRVFLLRGFVSRPQIQKSNRNSIYLFVNGRLIRDRLLLHALTSAYHNLMPSACYPFALLFLDCDAAEVDVNVHPSKTEVRFRHASVVHDFVRDTIRERLIESRPPSSLPLPHDAYAGSPVNASWSRPDPQPAARLPFSEFSASVERGHWPDAPSEVPRSETPGAVPPPSWTALEVPADPSALGPGEQLSEIPEFRVAAPPATPAFDVSQTVRLPAPDTHGGIPAEADLEAAATLNDLRDLRPLGQLHSSFIIAAGRDGLWIIDQHVAHERILFEQVLRQQAAGQVERQQLLLPALVELTPAQQIEYERIAGDLEASGFETEPFGPRTVAVKATPAGLAMGDAERVIREILEISEREFRKAGVGDLRRAMAASIACRAAIKINMRLDETKMRWLLERLAATECPMSCPHGRPIALRYAVRDILKGFHRI